MKKLFILLLISQFVFTALNAQSDYYYWYDNQKIYLDKISDKKFVIIDDAINDRIGLKQFLDIDGATIVDFERSNVLNTINAYESLRSTENYWAIIESSDIADIASTDHENILYEAPFYTTAEGIEVGLSHLFYVRLRDEKDIVKLEQLAKQKNVEILGNNYYMPLWFTLSTSQQSKGNALEMANYFYETELFSTTQPNLMTDLTPACVDDEYFSDHQWNLQNTGQHGGTVGIDINICNAWDISTGSSEIIVAVLDHGLEFDHPDLPNIYPISYDTESPPHDPEPSKVYGNHGMPCAGIIGAQSNNEIGVAGIAPDCQLMSISNSLTLHPNINQELANGINFAWQNNASIISNSWGHNLLEDDLIDDAIDNALTQGRNGLGTVVFFAAGNTGGPVNYPANSNPDILAVGALEPTGEKADFSSYGTELDIVAPGVLVPSTDRQVPNGYNPNSDYTQDFGGTSAAAPHVAGVAALILSVNPDYTVQEVNNIIERTARKVGNYNYQPTQGRPNGDWHEEVGYGLLDAYEALINVLDDLCPPIPFENRTVWRNRTLNYCHTVVNNVTVSGGSSFFWWTLSPATLTINSEKAVLEDNVTVQDGAKLHINADNVRIDKNFEAERGSELVIE